MGLIFGPTSDGPIPWTFSFIPLFRIRLRSGKVRFRAALSCFAKIWLDSTNRSGVKFLTPECCFYNFILLTWSINCSRLAPLNSPQVLVLQITNAYNYFQLNSQVQMKFGIKEMFSIATFYLFCSKIVFRSNPVSSEKRIDWFLLLRALRPQLISLRAHIACRSSWRILVCETYASKRLPVLQFKTLFLTDIADSPWGTSRDIGPTDYIQYKDIRNYTFEESPLVHVILGLIRL